MSKFPGYHYVHFSHMNHHQHKKFTCENMNMFNTRDTSSGKNLHNIPGPPGIRTPIPLLSPLAYHPVPSVLRSNIHEDLDDSPLFTSKKNSKHLRHEYCSKNWTNEIDKDKFFGQPNTSIPDHWSRTPHPAS